LQPFYDADIPHESPNLGPSRKLIREAMQ
jgi:hypothetical protein